MYKPQIISGKSDKYYMYVVDPTHKKRVKDVEMRKRLKSVRAGKITDALGEILSRFNAEFDKDRFDRYIQAFKANYEEEAQERNEERTRLRTVRTNLRKKKDTLEGNFLMSAGSYSADEKKRYRSSVDDVEKEINEYSTQLIQLEELEASTMPSFENFLNTAKILSESYNSLSANQKMDTAQTIVLNTWVHDGVVLQIDLIPPYDELFDKNGWGGGIRTPECRYQKPMPYHLATPQLYLAYITVNAIIQTCKYVLYY